MTARLHWVFALTVSLTACASYEGTYTPACIAFAGDEIKLKSGRFVWDKFTDQVLVNDAGEKVDPFPDHPVRGRYTIEDQKLILDPYTSDPLPEMYLHSEGEHHYIMSAEQFRTWQQTGRLDDCALVLGGRPE